MNIFVFLFYLGIINIIFSFLWKWFFVLPTAFLFALLNFDYGMRAVKVFGSYLLVSLTALITLAALGNNPGGFSLIFYPIISAFVLFMAYASNQYAARKEANATMNWQMIQKIERDSGFEAILSIGVVILYIITLFVPSIAANGLNAWLFRVIVWIFNLPIIGWLIGIGGLFFLLNIIFHGLLATGLITAFIVGKFRKEKTENNSVVAKKEEHINVMNKLNSTPSDDKSLNIKEDNEKISEPKSIFKDKHKIAPDIATILLTFYQIVKKTDPDLEGEMLYKKVLETWNLNLSRSTYIDKTQILEKATGLNGGDGLNLRKIAWEMAIEKYLKVSNGEEALDDKENESEITKIKEKWPAILDEIRTKNFSLEALLRTATITKCTKTDIILEVPYEFHIRIIKAPKNKRLLESVISSISGRDFKVSAILIGYDAEAEAYMEKWEREFKKDYSFMDKMRDEIAKIIPEGV